MVITCRYSVCSTADLLEKVGELVDKLFDLDEELMKSWITAQPSEEEEDGESRLDVASCLLEAAKQLRWESEILIQENVICIFMPMFIFSGNKKVYLSELLGICNHGTQLHHLSTEDIYSYSMMHCAGTY